MSGHSKWATTKHKKAVIDARRATQVRRVLANVARVRAFHADLIAWVLAMHEEEDDDDDIDDDDGDDPVLVNPNRSTAKHMNLADLGAPRELSRRER